MLSILAALLIAGPGIGESLPGLLAGRLGVSRADSARWNWTGAWILPVGDPCRLAGPEDGPGEFHVLRGLGTGEGGHQGVDLGDGRGGEEVRAAADGLVAFVARQGWQSGYGRHVVLVHRLEDGTPVYSVYAHLRKGSIPVRAGERVGAGRRIGRVGRSGRASAEHLHFEIRLPSDPFDRWENQPVTDPIAFVRDRLPAHCADTSWAAPYLGWADRCGLIEARAVAGDALNRGAWWRILARAARHGRAVLPATPDSLRGLLVTLEVLPALEPDDPGGSVDWAELARDLKRLARHGLRILPPSAAPHGFAEESRQRLGTSSAGTKPESIRGGGSPHPSLADACLACAAVSLGSASGPRRKQPPGH